MKTQFHIFRQFALIGMLLISVNVFAQQELHEAEMRKHMKADGLDDKSIDELFAKEKAWNLKIQKLQSTNVKKENPLPVPFATCSDMGAENGWGSWEGKTGSVNIFGAIAWTTTATPTSPRFDITNGGGVDGCTPGAAAPPLPVTCPFPGFGNSSIQLGEPTVQGYGAEMLTYSLTVTPQDTNFIYAYALVIQNPTNHPANMQPYVELCIKDAAGNPVPCGCFRYTGGPNLPGFFEGLACQQPSQGTPWYKPWTVVGVNLSAYVGQTVTITILNVDCSQGAHFAHSYWDFSCGIINIAGSGSCSTGGTASICAPVDPAIAYTYQWYQNNSPYAGPPSSTAQCITPTYQQSDTFTVAVKQPSGCNFYLTYVPQTSNISVNITPTNISCSSTGSATANVIVGGTSPFTYNWSNGQNTQTISGLAAGNYTVTITDASGCTGTATVTLTASSSFSVSSTSTPAVCNTANGSATATPSSGTPAFTYVWNPAAAGQTTQTVTGLLAGIYTVTITDANGCVGTDTITVPFILSPPVGNFSSPPVCLGNITQFTDNSSGNPTTWNWDFGDGNNSFVQNPSHSYAASGTYSVTLIVSNPDGCLDTVVIPVTVNSLPTAAITPSSPCLGSSTQLNDGSVSPQGDPIIAWNWTIPGGNPVSSTNQNTSSAYTAAGTHSVTLAITTQAGCMDTIIQQVLVYTPPVADFSGPISGCAPICNNYTDLSTSSDGNITDWQWSFPGGSATSSTIQNPQNICYNTPGTYGATLIITTTYGCKDTISLSPLVNAYAGPTADFCVTPLMAPATDPVFNFCDMWSSDVVQWIWNFGDNDSDLVNTDPIHSYSATANVNDFYTYNICVRVENQYGCWDDICKVVELVPEFTFYIPNTFTPNGDWMNEMFYGKSRGVKEYNIWLFDRWGNQIWDCHKEDKNTNWDSDATLPRQEGLSSFCQWDGVVVQGGADMSGNTQQLAQEDVYVWKVKLTDIFDKHHSYIGHVSIVR